LGALFGERTRPKESDCSRMRLHADLYSKRHCKPQNNVIGLPSRQRYDGLLCPVKLIRVWRRERDLNPRGPKGPQALCPRLQAWAQARICPVPGSGIPASVIHVCRFLLSS
jgi:hypothetical protein